MCVQLQFGFWTPQIGRESHSTAFNTWRVESTYFLLCVAQAKDLLISLIFYYKACFPAFSATQVMGPILLYLVQHNTADSAEIPVL